MYTLPIDFATPAFDEVLSLRYEILKKPLDLEFNPEIIIPEWENDHLGIYNSDHKLIGCLCIVHLDKNEAQVRQVAVLEEVQGNGVGTALMNACEKFCKQKNIKKIVLHARLNSVLFYEKLSYKKQGRKFEEVGLPHYKMYKAL